MIGQGVLRECMADPGVDQVLAIGRSSLDLADDKLIEIVRSDLTSLSPAQSELSGFDACFFCLGVSAAGMSEAKYTALTYDLTLGIAKTLSHLNPQMTFVYVSGMNTDSTEKGSAMWARVKGRTENALMRLPFKAVYLFRPGIVQPMDGIKSRTPLYRFLYTVLGPLTPLIKAAFPNYVTTTRQMGIAMLGVARRGFPKHVLEVKDINSVKPG
jgi:uncharacterized protein YbjT (DUF2867 family)